MNKGQKELHMICLVRSLYFLFYLFVLKMCLYYGMVANEIFLSASKGSVHGKFSSLQHQSFLLMSIIFIACNQTMYRLFQYSCSQASFLNLWLVLFRMMQHIATSYSSFSFSLIYMIIGMVECLSHLSRSTLQRNLISPVKLR